MENNIHIKNVTKKYSEKTVIKNMELDIKSGEITTIVAPNGTGKTTLLSLISGLLIPEEGVVEYEGFKRNDINVILSGEKNLYMKNTVKENILYFGIIQGLSKKEILRRIETYREDFPFYHEVKDKLVEELSYGQKRLIAIFSALIVDAKCIMIDEASEGLDMSYVDLLTKILKRISENKIIILASHDYDFVADVSDKILFLKDGIIVKSFDKLNLEQVKEEYITTFLSEE